MRGSQETCFEPKPSSKVHMEVTFPPSCSSDDDLCWLLQLPTKVKVKSMAKEVAFTFHLAPHRLLFEGDLMFGHRIFRNLFASHIFRVPPRSFVFMALCGVMTYSLRICDLHGASLLLRHKWSLESVNLNPSKSREART